MQPLSPHKDSTAWIIQRWASFILSVSMTTLGIVNLPLDNWVKGFMGMGLAFSVGSSFTLSKTVRDRHEASKITARIDDAQVEKLLTQHHPLK
jgi:hypothetical protein